MPRHDRPWRLVRMLRSLAAVLLLLAFALPAAAQVVALGASNTAGKGVSPHEAYPAQLEAMLRAEGRQVRVLNAGVVGDTTAGMLQRLNSAVPAGTRVVILQPGGNDQRQGEAQDRSGNLEQIRQHLEARNIRIVMLGNGMLQSIPAELYQRDRLHLTPEGYRLLASRMLPRVKAALEGRG